MSRERPDQVEGGEPGQQIGMGEQIGTCLHADLPRESLPQLLRTQQISPLAGRPRPEVSAQLAAVVQHDRGGVAGEPPLKHSVGMPVQNRQRLVQRRGQPQNRLPAWVITIPIEPQQVETEAVQRIGFVPGQPVAPPETVDVQRPCPGRCCGRPDGRRTRSGHGRPVSCSPRRVSISTRQAWIWSMPRASLSAKSRPDRWI